MKFKHNAIVNIGHLSVEERDVLIQKCGEIGYTPGLFYFEDKIYLLTRNGIGRLTTWTIIEYNISYKDSDFINCGINTDLFLAVIAIRPDSDYMQWFIDNSSGKFSKCYSGHFEQMDIPNFRKATIEELKEYFKEEESMKNLTKEQKGVIASEFIKENLHDAAIYLMIALGKECKDLGANITYSTQSKNVENPTVYRLHVSTVDSKERMDDEYFIEVISYAPDNILEKMLEREFRKHEHTTIQYAQIPDLKEIYLSVIERYQKNGGPERPYFSIEDNKNDRVWIRIGDKLQLTLYKIVGEFWTETTERKEDKI